MGIFKITLQIRAPAPPYPTITTVVFREYPGNEIDKIWHKLEIKSQEKWGRDLKGFDCVMISKRSAEYKTYMLEEEKKRQQPGFQVVSGRRFGKGFQHPFSQEESNR